MYTTGAYNARQRNEPVLSLLPYWMWGSVLRWWLAFPLAGFSLGGEDQEGHQGKVKTRGSAGITFIVGTLFHIPDYPDPGYMNQQSWLPPCRPYGLRWQGQLNSNTHTGSAPLWSGSRSSTAEAAQWRGEWCGAGIILTLTTESIEEHTEKQKRSVHSWDTTKYRTKKLTSHLILEASTSSPFFIHIRLFSS